MFAVLACLLSVSWPSSMPTVYRSSSLRRLVYSGGAIPDRVYVLFAFPLHSTADPLTFEYRPSLLGSVDPTYVLTFRSLPQKDIRAVVGNVSGFRPDLLRRKDSIPGVVVMVDCEVP